MIGVMIKIVSSEIINVIIMWIMCLLSIKKFFLELNEVFIYIENCFFYYIFFLVIIISFIKKKYV